MNDKYEKTNDTVYSEANYTSEKVRFVYQKEKAQLSNRFLMRRLSQRIFH